MTSVFSEALSSLTIKIRIMACLGAILVSTMLFNGCTTVITQNYEHKIKMTKAEAVQILKRYFNNNRELSVNETHLAFSYTKYVVDYTWDTTLSGLAPHFPGESGPYIRHTRYHYEDRSFSLEFADVSKIKRFSHPQLECLMLYDNKGVYLNEDFDFPATNEFISALLTLCPNIGPASSRCEEAGEDAESPSKNSVSSDEVCKLVKQGDLNKIKSILDANPKLVNSNNNGVAPLHVAAVNGYKDIAELLIAKGADVTAKGSGGLTPLHFAAIRRTSIRQQGCIEVAELLIAKGAEINAKANDGSTPLHCAANVGHKDMAEFLITKGAQVNANNNRGCTPLYLAAENGHMNMVELLVSKGANVNAKTDNGHTPLHLAASNGYMNVVELLVSKGANVNAKADNGETPLHNAAFMGFRNITELLISKGADVNARASGGGTPLHYAVMFNAHKEVADLLRQHGAKE